MIEKGIYGVNKQNFTIYTYENDVIGAVFTHSNEDDSRYEKRMIDYFKTSIVKKETQMAISFYSWLCDYFEGKSMENFLHILPWGTPFQTAVYKRLLTIPYGTTTTYKEVAKDVCSGAYRAVGSAVGSNPIIIAIPCHRVINTNGEIGNYSGGKGRETKVQLLQLERKCV